MFSIRTIKNASIALAHKKLSCYRENAQRSILLCPRTCRGGGGIKRWSASVVCPSVCRSVCLMSRTSALTRKPKGLGRRNFAQGYPRSHATPTPTSMSKGQKSRWGGGILWRPPSRTAYYYYYYKFYSPNWFVRWFRVLKHVVYRLLLHLMCGSL